MFFVCHSKLEWKQESVWCQQRRMSNADVEVFYFNTLLELNFSVAPSSRGNGSHKERCGKCNWLHCTRYLILFFCYM